MSTKTASPVEPISNLGKLPWSLWYYQPQWVAVFTPGLATNSTRRHFCQHSAQFNSLVVRWGVNPITIFMAMRQWPSTCTVVPAGFHAGSRDHTADVRMRNTREIPFLSLDDDRQYAPHRTFSSLQFVEYDSVLKLGNSARRTHIIL